MMLLHQAQRQRHPPALLPILKRCVRFPFDPGTTTEGFRYDFPPISICVPEVDVRKILQPMILVGAIAGERQVVTPVTQIENEMEMEALAPAIDNFIASIVSESLKGRVDLPQFAIPNHVELPG